MLFTLAGAHTPIPAAQFSLLKYPCDALRWELAELPAPKSAPTLTGIFPKTSSPACLQAARSLRGAH